MSAMDALNGVGEGLNTLATSISEQIGHLEQVEQGLKRYRRASDVLLQIGALFDELEPLLIPLVIETTAPVVVDAITELQVQAISERHEHEAVTFANNGVHAPNPPGVTGPVGIVAPPVPETVPIVEAEPEREPEVPAEVSAPVDEAPAAPAVAVDSTEEAEWKVREQDAGGYAPPALTGNERKAAAARANAAAAKAASRSAVEKALERIPVGEWFSTGQIAKLADLSVGPVVTVIRAMHQEGLLEFNGKGGAWSRYMRKDPSTPEPEVAPEPVVDVAEIDWKRVNAKHPGTKDQQDQRRRMAELLDREGEQLLTELPALSGMTASQVGNALVFLEERSIATPRRTLAGEVRWRLVGHPTSETTKPGVQNLRARVLGVVQDSASEGLTSDQIVMAIAELGGDEPAELVKEEIRKLWRASEITRQGVGTYVITVKGIGAQLEGEALAA